MNWTAALIPMFPALAVQKQAFDKAEGGTGNKLLSASTLGISEGFKESSTTEKALMATNPIGLGVAMFKGLF